MTSNSFFPTGLCQRVLLAVMVLVVAERFVWADTQGNAAELHATVAKLIRQLGDEEYSTREKSQAALERLGLDAFDALQEAQNHEDLEIAMRSRYVLRNLPVSFFRDGDSPVVRQALEGYGQRDEIERRGLLDRIATMEGADGIAVLCRLARYETSSQLSKYAAQLALNQPLPSTPEKIADLQKKVDETVGKSKRPAANWLRAYSKTLQQPDSALDDWRQLINTEVELHESSPEQTKSETPRDLLRWFTDLLLRLERTDEAISVARRTLEFLEGDETELQEAVDWLLARKQWGVVAELAKHHDETFAESASLLYRLAESDLKQGRLKESQENADRAFALEEAEYDKAEEMGHELEARGLFEWAEREWRRAIGLAKQGGNVWDVVPPLCEMLHDQQRDLEAAELLQEHLGEGKEDADDDRKNYRSQMHYLFAEHFRAQKKTDEQIKHLEKAAAIDRSSENGLSNADVLIAMYRVESTDPAWRKKVKGLIWEVARKFHDEFDKFEQHLKDTDDNEAFRKVVSMYCNNYAWLISNTEGDFDEALRLSLRSLELRPGDEGLMDTLGRCYFAKGDLENAVKYQSLAHKKKPHSGAIRRQLELFEKARAAKG